MFIKERKFGKGQTLTEGMVRELIDDAVRQALATQARELESHLKDLHGRIQRLESSPR